MEVDYTKATREEAVGSGYRESIQTTLEHLIKTFGPPHFDGLTPDGKTRTEWAFKLEDGTIVTIYDHKSEINVADETDWHVGGKVPSPTIESMATDNEKILNWVTEKLKAV